MDIFRNSTYVYSLLLEFGDLVWRGLDEVIITEHQFNQTHQKDHLKYSTFCVVSFRKKAIHDSVRDATNDMPKQIPTAAARLREMKSVDLSLQPRRLWHCDSRFCEGFSGCSEETREDKEFEKMIPHGSQ